ncbi:mitogen-activated protein kinase [Blastocystis sp. ATCC 50177/Nand II]|uniref:Mitogen-activated protein kinase n=1 Tax=Blastocystis sp. subtype 1 (strain ATCC 50177 / NandII) TaxID=478820 RepID=A0A196SJ90_BLAHN|nr:mitogen-activated protein kinase [Blastocystis sp. ATCC 50177/Nand II]
MILDMFPRQFYTIQVDRQLFHIDIRYQNLKVIGSGSYGVVCSADDVIAGRRVAIKKIGNLFQDIVDAKRVLREIKMLRHLGWHENVISLYDVITMPYGREDFTDIYIVTQLFECDLERIISSNQPLSENHIQFFLFQLLKALKFLHSAKVLHRDLKPSNILVNSNCCLAICDFGLARGLAGSHSMMTEYVVTRWYRAPELLCENSTYDWEVDIWSLGCIFAELLGRQPLLQGKNPYDQLKLVIKLLGPQRGASLNFIQKAQAREAVEKMDYGEPIPFEERFPHASANAIDLLKRMLVFDATKRISVDDALCHPFLAALTREYSRFPVTDPFNYDYEKRDSSGGSAHSIPSGSRTLPCQQLPLPLLKNPTR